METRFTITMTATTVHEFALEARQAGIEQYGYSFFEQRAEQSYQDFEAALAGCP